jgi:hypothetical protein
MSYQEPLTYEASKALQSTWGQPEQDPLGSRVSFCNSPYRLLHHQKGLIGTFRVQLLEARNLERSYWSALALGPVKHLGLSKRTAMYRPFAPCSSNFLHSRIPNDVNQKKPPAPSEKYTSSVAPNQNNPVWPHCEWDIPLRKNLADGAPDSVAC